MGDFEEWQHNKVAAAINESVGEKVDELVGALLDGIQDLLDDARTCRAYDEFAREALRGLFVNLKPGVTADEITNAAWEIADAMMAERKKRNLGHVEIVEADKEG